jgi:hypothetical protein
VWLREQLGGLGAALEVCGAPATLTVGLIDSRGERTFLTTRSITVLRGRWRCGPERLMENPRPLI